MKLYKIYNNIIPFEGYLAITVWPWVFIRKDCADKYDDTAHRHETTHALQQVECLLLGLAITAILLVLGCGWWSLIPIGFFFEWYLLEWLIKVVLCFFANRDAYYSISFEQEAFEHEEEVSYNEIRKDFEWIKYIFKLKKRRRKYEV